MAKEKFCEKKFLIQQNNDGTGSVTASAKHEENSDNE
jgi:hypothetical protein